jgi:hypothetical protein
MERVKGLIDGGATSIGKSPNVLRNPALPHELAFTSNQGVNAQVMMSVKESRKASLLVQYFELLKPVGESEITVVPMSAYDLVLGLARFMARNPEIDWNKGPLTSLPTPNGSQQAHIPEAN